MTSYEISPQEKIEEVSQVFTPWRRYFARMLDFSIYSSIFWIVTTLLFNVNLIKSDIFINLIDLIVSTLLMIFIEPLLLSKFGTTIGKFILGLSIKNVYNENLTYQQALKRTWMVIGQGMGYQIPIYSIVRLIKSYNITNNMKPQDWDMRVSYKLKDTKSYRNIIYILTVFLTVFALFVTFLFLQIPPNRGDLTIEEYAENFNYYSKLYDVSFNNSHLDSNGNWKQNDSISMSYLQSPYKKLPFIMFETENGYIKKVSFEIKEEFTKESFNSSNYSKIITSYEPDIFIASMAFIAAQKEVNVFTSIDKNILNHIQLNGFKKFNFTEAGITVNSICEYNGFYNSSEYLVAKDNSEIYSFSIDFNATK